MKKLSINDRMREQYEHRFRYMLPRRTYTIIRLDGKAFGTYTSKLAKPFDQTFIDHMELTAQYACKQMQGCKFAFTHSDEMSFLLTDFDTHETEAWFDNNLQKMCSVACSIVSSAFNKLRNNSVSEGLAFFDARVFQIPDRNEVENYFIARQQDCTRNSVHMLASSVFSHNELKGKNGKQMMVMMESKCKYWDKLDPREKRGTIILKDEQIVSERDRWYIDHKTPIFTQERKYLSDLIPVIQ